MTVNELMRLSRTPEFSASLRAQLLGVAVALAAVAVLIAWVEPEAPQSIFSGPIGITLLVVTLLAMCTSAIMWGIERREGKAPRIGAWWAAAKATVIFRLGWMGAVAALGLAAAIVWATQGAWSDLLWRATFVLLAVGAFAGFAGTLAANLLFLLLPRGR